MALNWVQIYPTHRLLGALKNPQQTEDFIAPSKDVGKGPSHQAVIGGN
uniref:Uncharacterized protein n=1 Tax=Physcomitrium patens TaxID=3218 RepID=A0A2K1IXK3_PHYPA|nr:hypothetical protein PHYPA_023820 [Physcomitrium patens]